MSTNKQILISAAVVLAAGFSLLTNCREKEGAFDRKPNFAQPEEKKDPLDSVVPATGAASRAKGRDANVKSLDKKTKVSDEVRALLAMNQVLALAIQPETNLEKLVTRLVEYGIEPEITHNRNEETGDQLTVRSKNPFKGTRYFHALYFGGAGLTPFPQHISFEFRPGPNALKEVILAVEQTFPLAGPAVENTAVFKKYRLNEDYILWIKEMDAEDMADHPVNSYDASDLGTIKIAIEIEIHEGSDDHH